MQMTRTDLCVKKSDKFEIVKTQIATTTDEINIIIKNEDTGGKATIPIAMFKSYLLRLMDGHPVLPIDPHIRRWFAKLNAGELKNMYEKCLQAENDILMNPRDPKLSLDTGTVLYINSKYLSKWTIARVKTCASALHAVELPIDDGENETGWFMPVPTTIGRLPDDLANCFRFANKMDMQFIFFRSDAPLYADITSLANTGGCTVTSLTYQDGDFIPH